MVHSFHFQILSQPLLDLVNQFTHIHGAQQDHFEPVAAQTFLHDVGSAGDDPDGEFTGGAKAGVRLANEVLCSSDLAGEKAFLIHYPPRLSPAGWRLLRCAFF